MMDLDLGMNNWMSDAFTYPTKPINRGKLLTAEKLKELGDSGAATRTWTATASRTARCRATACRRTSRAAPATTPRASTASGPTTTSRTWTGSRASSRRRARTCRAPVVQTNPKAKIGFIALRHVALRDRREPRSAARGDEGRDVVLPAARVSVHAGAGGVHRRARARLRHRAEPRRAAAAADEAGAHAGSRRRSCAACCTTTACRSTPAASPTMCWRRKASKWRRRRPSRMSAGTAGGE